MSRPVEPPPTAWRFPDPTTAGPDDLVAVGADLQPATVLAAYRRGMFPMPLPDGQLGWWSPSRRAVIPLNGLRVSRSLRRSTRRFAVAWDTSFAEVVAGCADPSRPDGWITEDIADAYVSLHEMGWAHSVEVYAGPGNLVGGLYGLAIGGAFFGESMFHRATDASKVALVALVERMNEIGASLLDVQWRTDHLSSLGAIEVSRETYLQRLEVAVDGDALPWATPSHQG